MTRRRLTWAALPALLALALPALAAAPQRWQLNMTPGVTDTSRSVYDLHMMVLWVCVIIGVIVFGAMAYAMFKFRRSKGAVAATFSHNTTAELIWTIVPILILIVMAFPATKVLVNMADSSNAELTVKVTGYQWRWRYEYLGTPVNFMSSLAYDSNKARHLGSGIDPTTVENYLLEVDNPLVIPAGTKVRFVVTADDVIHAWWVPQLGWKQDAIPGFINDAWTKVDQPGIYRGQCAELCGKDHGFMPVVVKVVPKAEFQQWLADESAARGRGAVAAAPQAAPALSPAATAPEAAPAKI